MDPACHRTSQVLGHGPPGAPPNPFCGSPNSRQIFQNGQRVGTILVHECLTGLMVHIGHPTVFSLTETLQTSSGGRRLPTLQVLPEDLKVGASRFDSPAPDKGGPSLGIVGGHQKVDPEDQPDDLTNLAPIGLGHLLRHRHMETPALMPVHKMGGTKLPGAIKKALHSPQGERYEHPTGQRIEGEPASL